METTYIVLKPIQKKFLQYVYDVHSKDLWAFEKKWIITAIANDSYESDERIKGFFNKLRKSFMQNFIDEK